MKSKQRRTAMVKLIKCHWEKMHSTSEKCIAYCKKDGLYYEDGDTPITGPQTIKRDYAKAFALAKTGRSDEIEGGIQFTHFRTIQAIEQKHPVQVDDLTVRDNTWIYGPPQCGKSSWARKEIPQPRYDKHLNKWWDGYQGQDVILDDVSPQQGTWLGVFLKRWLDYYSFPAEVKGTTIIIRPKKFIITSNHHPCFIFLDPVECTAICARLKIIEMDKDGNMVEGLRSNAPGASATSPIYLNPRPWK